MLSKGSTHHVFPYDPSHLGLTSDVWIDAQVGRWPLAAVLRTNADRPTFVHFISRKRVLRKVGHLQFVGHPSLLTGPRWWDWGDDWSASLGRRLSRLTNDDLCILHLDSYETALRVHSLVRRCPIVVVLHGRGFGGAHIRDADAVVGLRQEVKTQLMSEGYPADRLIIVPPSVDRSLFAHARPSSSFPLRLGFVGTVSPSKGTRQILETVALLRQSGASFMIDILGTGQSTSVEEFSRGVTDAGATGQVNMVGHVTPEVVARHMANWHLLLHPSYTEGMPIVVLEALSTGLPVVAVRGVLPPEMERQCGVYVTERESYAATLVRDYSRMQATPCGTELVVDHSEGAAVWSQLQSLTQRGMPLPKPARLARYWRLRPLRDFVREKAGMRGWIRGVRRRLGAWGGLP